MVNSQSILVVDDEAGIRTVLRGVLESAGYQVDTADSGETALTQLTKASYDLLLVDLQMTGIGGLEVIRQARTRYPNLATVILTGFATVDTAVAALHEGVDDYLVKPAKPQAVREAVQRALSQRQAEQEKTVLLSRIAADVQKLFGEAQPSATPVPLAPQAPILQQGPLSLNETTHQATWFGRSLNLTPTEFKLLVYLARHANTPHSPQALVTAVQGYHCSPQEARELIKPHLYSLRAALETDPAHPQYLINVRGIGYMLRLENQS